MKQSLIVAMIQMSSVLLQREATIDKMVHFIEEASEKGAELCVFGESILPGYPFWIENTEGAKFNNKVQKEIHAAYIKSAIQPENGDLIRLQKIAKSKNVGLVFGSMERAVDRGGHSLYCSMIYIDSNGEFRNSHRKLMPTYEERLSWSPGDGHGLNVFPVGPFTMGGLNCWENWMPLARTALYGQGENLHIAIWPGNVRNTDLITPFIAQEGRSFVISVCGLMSKDDIPQDFPYADVFRENAPAMMANGGSCIAAPDGSWLVEPVKDEEGVIIAELDFNKVLEERHNFDPVGHYSRPDVFQLKVNKRRQSGFQYED